MERGCMVWDLQFFFLLFEMRCYCWHLMPSTDRSRGEPIAGKEVGSWLPAHDQEASVVIRRYRGESIGSGW